MNNQQKYINYVVDNLVKNTEIVYDEERINYPFHRHSSSPFLFSLSYFSFSSFTEYVKETYGTKDEEVSIIWVHYKNRIQTLINNE